MADTPISIESALDMIRAAAAPADADPAPSEPEQTEAAVEPDAVAADTFEAEPAPELATEEPAEEAAPEAETLEDADPSYVELPDRLRQAEDGSWEVKVRVDHEDVYLPLDGALENLQKQEAAEKRFIEASTKAKEAELSREQANAQLQAYQESLMAMQQELQAVQAASQLTPEQEAQLADADPKALLQIKKLQEARETKLAEIQQQQQQAYQQVVAHQAQRAMELLPEWSDPEVLNREREGIVQTALNSGFSSDEINSMTDARFLPVLRKAWLYDQLQAGSQSVKQKQAAPKTMVRKKAPVAKEPTQQRRQREAMSKLSRTGKMDDALGVLMARRG